MQKVVRVELIPIETEEISFKDIYKVLFDLRYECRQISNRAVQICWEFSGLESDYKKQFDHYPDRDEKSEIIGYPSIDSYVYNAVSSEFTKLQTGCLGQILHDVCGKFKKDKKDYFCGEKSIASYKKSNPITINKHSIALNYDAASNKWSVELGILSNAYRKELGLSGRLAFKVKVKGRSAQAILERCHDDVYQITASKLLYNEKKNTWFLNLGYAFEGKKSDEFTENLIMGVFIGKFNAVTCSFNNVTGVLSLAGGEVEQFRSKTEARRRLILRNSKTGCCGEGRIGHGRATRLKPAEHVGNVISNFRDTINHRYSKLIVDFARKNHCGVIQMEDLTGVSEKDKFLKNWSYYDLQQKIIYKAATYGITVIKIKTKYLAERCSDCGKILDSEAIDPKNFKFVCPACGFDNKVDYNASQNLATKDIDLIIEEEMKKSGLEDAEKPKKSRRKKSA